MKILFLILLFTFTVSAQVKKLPISLKIDTNKNNFILGEVVALKFRTINQGKISLKIYNGSVGVGSLKLLISDANNGYKEYVGPGWGRLTGSKEIVQPKQFLISETSILWNSKPNIEGWSELYAKPIKDSKIMSDYAFPVAGVYFIKAVAFVDDGVEIESEPVKITVSEPVGKDLLVWKQIENNRDLAYLMQTGEIQERRKEVKAKIINTVENIIRNYPNSSYSKSLKTNLQKFKEAEIRRMELYKTN